ncbi:UvrB/UvrC motif-containing protein [Ruminococcaceae bacterium OttesenSCG-928-A11]|nr:UvrB/UvrC motif-containing protein [Ruminococcaceae bacterium OttesenSCG-928-A11]
MKCQHCHEKEAVNTFLVAFPGGQQEVHLCEDCTRMAKQYYEMAQRANPGLFQNPESAAASSRKVGNIPFPENAGADIRRRRQLNMLKARLAEAIKTERYEEAARLRDQIAVEEKDVVVI